MDDNYGQPMHRVDVLENTVAKILDTLAEHLAFAHEGFTADYADRTEACYYTRLFHEAKLEVLREIVGDLKETQGSVGDILRASLRESLGDLYDDTLSRD